MICDLGLELECDLSLRLKRLRVEIDSLCPSLTLTPQLVLVACSGGRRSSKARGENLIHTSNILSTFCLFHWLESGRAEVADADSDSVLSLG